MVPVPPLMLISDVVWPDSVPPVALKVPSALVSEMPKAPAPDDTLVNCRFIPAVLPLMLTAPPVVLLIDPAEAASASLTCSAPTLVPVSETPALLPQLIAWMSLLPFVAAVMVPLIWVRPAPAFCATSVVVPAPPLPSGAVSPWRSPYSLWPDSSSRLPV